MYILLLLFFWRRDKIKIGSEFYSLIYTLYFSWTIITNTIVKVKTWESKNEQIHIPLLKDQMACSLKNNDKREEKMAFLECRRILGYQYKKKTNILVWKKENLIDAFLYMKIWFKDKQKWKEVHRHGRTWKKSNASGRMCTHHPSPRGVGLGWVGLVWFGWVITTTTKQNKKKNRFP